MRRRARRSARPAASQIGFVDIADPRAPVPAGTLDMGGEPTSVAVLGNHLALVGVNTSESFVDPSGHLAVVAIPDRVVLAELDLMLDLLATNGWITDKPKGVAVTRDGHVFVVTDNDGVEDWSGETWFLRLGHVRHLF